MCGRFTLENWDEIHALIEKFNLSIGKIGEGVAEHPARYNIAPTQPVVTIFEERGEREARLMRWGLVPVWVKDPRDFSTLINARAETILEKPSFRGGLQHHRCLIPASGYYEWRTGPDGRKQPFYMTARNGAPLMLGGIYSTWLGATGEEIDTAAIITVKANADTRFIHDRMPAVIPPDWLDNWLSIGRIGPKEALRVLTPAPAGTLDAVPVSTRVNAIRNDGPELIVPVTAEKPEPPAEAESGQGELF